MLHGARPPFPRAAVVLSCGRELRENQRSGPRSRVRDAVSGRLGSRLSVAFRASLPVPACTANTYACL